MQPYIFLFLLFFINNTLTGQNIILIESDDQSNQAVGAFGNPDMHTPNIDQLVKDGTSFTAAYNTGCWSPAVCVPSRTMLMYGKQLWEAQKITKKNAPKSLPERLKERGYYTYMTGKWHAMGKSPQAIFDSLGTIQKGQLETYYQEKGHATDITGKEAADFINSYDSSNPFFVYVAFNAPHVPRQTAQKYYDRYPTEKIQLPPSVVKGPLNPNIKYNYTKAPLKPSVMKKRVQQNNAMVTHMDERIGDILQALKNKNLYDDSIVIFMSDHGISFGENGVAGKVCLYEPSVTAPLIIKAPELPNNNIITKRVYLQDILPTLLEMLDIPIPEDMDFESLLPLIKEQKAP
ncbi:MAG: sulfatase-like hydrolase/transferase, partial [Bacteroidota bacterium]